MIKKLDQLIIKAFIGPFIAIFFVTLFVLVLQFFWLWLDDIVGKNVDLLTIAELVGWLSTTLVPLALPLAILISSIMTFGNLGETFELVAIKSAGISLLRFMRPLLIIALLFCGAAFLFNNNIIPVATLKMATMQYDIVMSKPAFDLREGVFYDKINGYVIKVGKKEKDNRTIHNIIIYERGSSSYDNIVIAKSGEMKMTPDKRSLEFNLKDGWRYEEQEGSSGMYPDYIRMGFKEYKKIFDLSSFKLNKTDDSTYKNNYRMLSIRQLNQRIDSLEKINDSLLKRTIIQPYFTHDLDTGWVKLTSPVKKIRSLKEVIPDSLHRQVEDVVISTISSSISSTNLALEYYKEKRRDLRLHYIEWNRKFSMSVACLILFLIGAPLGSIIRKGGLGMPLVFSIIFFVIFFLLNNFGEKFVKEDVLQPFAGMWMASFILLPIAIFLVIKAMHDSQLFNKEAYFRLYKKIFHRNK